MSTTITLELSEAVAEVLATPEGLRRAQALLEVAFADDESDPAVLAIPSGDEDRVLSPEASAQIKAAMEAPLTGPSQAVKDAIRQWKLLTGKSF